jgi:hypothetical protein
MNRRLALLAVVVAFLGGGSLSVAQGAVPQKLVGTWKNSFNSITIKASGRVVFHVGSEAVYDRVSVTATRATFAPGGGCAGKGVYSWKLKGRTLTFARIKDSCAVRRVFLPVTWTRK